MNGAKRFRKITLQRSKKDTLNKVLKQLKVEDEFELLNIDVEGHEYEVLKGLNFKKFKPKIITVEIHVKMTKEIFKTPVYKILKK